MSPNELRQPTLRRAQYALKRTLPPGGRRVLRQAGWAFTRLTSFARLLPTFIVVGGQRCGTASLYAYLLEHPAVAGFFSKQIYFFDAKFDRGVSWYRGHFPLATYRAYARHRFGAEPAIGEATADYLFHPHAAARIRSLRPDARLIVLLRDPVARAFSHYHLFRAKGFEALSFEEAVEREGERLDGQLERMLDDPSYWSASRHTFSYLARGRYKEQLERWLAVFPPEQLLILRSEDLFADPASVMPGVFEFLGVPAMGGAASTYPVLHAQRYEPMKPETRASLRRYFEQPNNELYSYLGRDFGWGPAEEARRALA
jgi:hypothetical protein